MLFHCHLGARTIWICALAWVGGLGACVGGAADNGLVTYSEKAAPSSMDTGGLDTEKMLRTGGANSAGDARSTGGAEIAGGTGSVGIARGDGGTGGMSGATNTGGAMGTGGLNSYMTRGTGGSTTSTGGTTTGMTTPVNDRGLVADFSVTTVTAGGDYSPRNIGAIWIEDAQGQWVKTLEHWAGFRGFYLKLYNAANPSGNVVDAITSATLPMHRTHNVTWNLLDASGNEVPDGDYTIMMEMTEQDSAGPSTSIVFSLGSSALQQSYPDAPNFTAMSLDVH